MKEIPGFKSEAEEFEFWSSSDSVECVDWSKARRARFSDLKPTQTPVRKETPRSRGQE